MNSIVQREVDEWCSSLINDSNKPIVHPSTTAEDIPEDPAMTTTELRILITYLRGGSRPKHAAKELLESESASPLGAGDGRLSIVLSDAILNHPELHPRLFELIVEIRDLEAPWENPENLERSICSWVGENSDEEWKKCYRNFLNNDHEAVAESSWPYANLTSWVAIEADRYRVHSKLQLAFGSITYGLENDLAFPEDQSLLQRLGPNPVVAASSWWFIRAGHFMYETVKMEEAAWWAHRFEPTLLWPADQGQTITRKRWRLWEDRLEHYANLQDDRLTDQNKELARRAVDRMRIVRKGFMKIILSHRKAVE